MFFENSRVQCKCSPLGNPVGRSSKKEGKNKVCFPKQHDLSADRESTYL